MDINGIDATHGDPDNARWQKHSLKQGKKSYRIAVTASQLPFKRSWKKTTYGNEHLQNGYLTSGPFEILKLTRIDVHGLSAT